MDSDSSATIEVTVLAPDWAETVTDFEGVCNRAAGAALAGLPGDVRRRIEVAILLVDDAHVRDLNRTWRGRDVATNVLSFANLDRIEDAPSLGPVILGDVVLAFETVRREALEQNKLLAAHLSHLVVHGLLHLLGHDHATDEEADRMEGLERRLVTGLGHADPYADPCAEEAA